MKTKLFILCTIVCAMFLTCCEEEEPVTSRKVETGKVSDVTLTSAIFHGVVNVDISQYSSVTFGVMLSDSKAELNERGGEMFKAKSLIGTDFKIEIGNLNPETKYYYCSWLFLNSTQYEFGDIKEFETLAPSPATVITNPITKIMTNSAVAGGCVKDDGGASVTERGVVYSLSKEPITSNYKVKSGSGVGEYTCNLTNLQDNAIYYVRAYAINQNGTAYGEEQSFTTNTIHLPSVSTSAVCDISSTSATVGGNVSNDGGAIVTERGIVYSTSKEPTTSNNKVKDGSGTGNFSCNLSNLQDEVTYYVRAYAINQKGTAYGAEISFSTPKRLFENGYEYIDLGLSVKWATCNVGANKPEDYGDYFAWGETEPKSTTYNWITYKGCRGSNDTQTKYCTRSSYGTVDNKTTLELSDDAARANWGGSWRMPTRAEQDELRNNCTWRWTTQNGVNGYKVTSKSNGKSIFLPAAGYRHGNSLSDAGGEGYYWSSSLDTGSSYNADGLHFLSGNVYRIIIYRYYGQSVRPICP